jgi:4-oxalocrotonate tautomerase
LKRIAKGTHMPLARIDLVQGKSAEYRRTIGNIVYEAMVDVLAVPKDDRFQIIADSDEAARA